MEKTLKLGRIKSKRRRRQQRIRCLEVISDPMDTNLGKLREVVRDREACSAAVHGVTKNWTQFINRTTTILLVRVLNM